MAQKVNEIMTRNIVTLNPQETIQEAAQLMNQHNIGAIPVVENGEVCGVITDRDITIRATSSGLPTNTPVSRCMTEGITVVKPDMDIHEAANLMAREQIRRLPVVENNQVVGMLAIGDLAEQNIYQNEAGDALSSISTPAQPDNISH
jgi:CBS domain-containing protein